LAADETQDGDIVKPYDELTYLGRVRRMRQLAHVALDSYGFVGARFKLLRQAGNTLYRVYGAGAAIQEAENGLYVPGHYLLRIHEPGYQATGAIELELEWLAAMCRDASLPVPEPISSLDGRLLIQISTPGIPGERNVSLLRWLKGRFIPDGIRARHYRAQGRLMAQLHEFSAHWQIPPGLAKRCWDWHGLFRDVEGAGIPGSKAWDLLPLRYHAAFHDVTQRAKALMEAWGRGPDVYGLIHADLGVDANVLFCGSPPEARAIDFDDSGFGYWMYDLAVSLEHCRDDAAYREYRDALLEGYAEVRSLPHWQAEQLEHFMAAFYVYVSLWCAAMTQLHPRHREELLQRLARAANLAEDFVKST
jgi:Ser/Thr protein kinase RdoA (MazF antagonist)